MTEEVWSWWQEGSIHRSEWPTPREIERLLPEEGEAARQEDDQAYSWATDVLLEVRKQRTEARQPFKVPISSVRITADEADIGRMPVVEADLRAALRVQAFHAAVGDPREIVVLGYDASASGPQT